MESLKSAFRPRWAITLFLSLLIGLTIAGHLSSPPPSQRTLFSDQAVHIAATLSIWHDHDLEYTLGDLERFRQTMPADPGPQGVFLKVGSDGKLYYAKPYLYAAFASPFIAAFGLDGFLIFNVLCLSAIGAVAIKALTPHFGQLNALLLATGLLLLSPFLAWTPIAHPDLFIAALVVVGGFLLLKPDYSPACKISGAVLLGLVLYEKPTFVFLVGPMLLALYRTVSSKLLVLLALLTYAAWAAPSTVNILQDGNYLAYKGLRFYVSGATRGTFPLEEHWSGPPKDTFTDHVFDASNIFYAITANLPLLPAKITDALIGRQTGLLLYFPVGLLLLGLLLPRVSWRGAALLGGLLAYLAFNWLVFPTNGYGGAGTYGPRYTMQALGVMLLAVVLPVRAGYWNATSSKSVTLVIGAMLALASIFQFRVIPPQPDAVGDPSWIFRSAIATLFPVESFLAPTISGVAPRSFSRTDGRRNYLYMIDGSGGSFQYDLGAGSASRDIVLFQSPRSLRRNLTYPSSIGVMVTRALELEFLARGEVLGRSTALPGTVNWVLLEQPFKTQFHDALIGPFNLQRITVRARPLDNAHASVPSWVNFCLGEFSAENGCFAIDADATPSRLAQHGIALPVGWQIPEDWGIWSSGKYAALSIRAPGTGRALQLAFSVYAFTPAEAPTLDVDVTVNGTFLETWAFRHGETLSHRTVRIASELIGSNARINIGFGIKQPRSPASLGLSSDPRQIGLGLADAQWSWIE